MSEYFFACTTKRRTKRADKMINTPLGPKVLLDWSVPLWNAVDHTRCGATVDPAGFRAWVSHPDNPAHGRYARFFLPRATASASSSSSSSSSAAAEGGGGIVEGSGGQRFLSGGGGEGSALMYRKHNCLAGDHDGTVR